MRAGLIGAAALVALAVAALPSAWAEPRAPAYAAAGAGKSWPCPPRAIRVAPGQSIQRAVDAGGPGAEICLGAGVHRAQAVVPLDRQSFQGEPGAILSGAEPLTGFKKRLGLWSAPFDVPPTPSGGNCMKAFPACDRPNVVFLDGRPLAAVASVSEIGPGRSFLDARSGRVYLADDPSGRSVEIARARFAFGGSASGVTIRNLTIEKFASPPQFGAIQAQQASRWSVEDCDVRLNSGAGVALGERGALRRCRVNDNGQIGVKGLGAGIVVEANRIRGNNTLGFDPAWEAGGLKLFASRDARLVGNEVVANRGAGLWCDTDCIGVEYADNDVFDNSAIGIFHEISFDARIHGNRLGRNGGPESSWFWGADIVLAGSAGVRVEGNRIETAAGRCGIVLIDQNRADGRGGRYRTRRDIVVDNTMKFAGRPCAGGVSDAQPGEASYGIIEHGENEFDRNTYYAPRGAPAGRFAWGRDAAGWEAWRAMGAEPHGRLILTDDPVR